MMRYVKVTYTGAVSVKVTLVDGPISAQWTAKSYLGNIGAATLEADRSARKALDEVRAALEPSPEHRTDNGGPTA